MTTYIRGLAEGFVDGLEVARDMLREQGVVALELEIDRCKKRLAKKTGIVARPVVKKKTEALHYSATSYFRYWAKQYNVQKLRDDIEYGRMRMKLDSSRGEDQSVFWSRHNAVYRAELMGREKWGWLGGYGA